MVEKHIGKKKNPEQSSVDQPAEMLTQLIIK